MARVIAAMPLLDPTLEGAARSTRAGCNTTSRRSRARRFRPPSAGTTRLRRQFVHARALAFPHGHPQERTIGFVSFLNQYGPALVERLDDELPLDLGRHWIVAI